MITVREIAWLAGLLEGEGNFCSDPSGSLARIKLEMKDRDIVQRAATLMGVEHIGTSKKRNPKHATTYWLYVCGQNAAGWAMTVYTFMGRRRRRAIKNMLEYWQSGAVAREALRQQ